MPLLNAITPLALYSWKEGEDKNSSQKIKATDRDIKKKMIEKRPKFSVVHLFNFQFLSHVIFPFLKSLEK